MSPTTLRVRTRAWVQRGLAEDRQRVEALARELRLPLPLCRLLVRRGYGEPSAARSFLKPRLERLHDPFEMAGMAAAVERIGQAIRRGERILVHGDYDVDGVCATALLTRVLRLLGGKADPFVPNRLADGYDLGPAGVRAARELGASLIVTVDCGILAHAVIADATRAGIDVVVTDHHTPGAELPPALAVLNPNRPDCGYPEKSLCGTGVAFKLCEALAREHGLDRETLDYHLDLVALATVADVVPLTGENRVLAAIGLRVLAQTRNPGLAGLIRRLGLADGRRLQARHLSHVLGPRVNAVGRLDQALWGVRLLLAEAESEVETLVERLEVRNRERQQLDRQTLAEAVALLEASYDPDRDHAVVLASRGWHQGVIGIVASRVVELIHRPTVLIALDSAGGPARGSARSIAGFHLYEALHACREHLTRYGGHRYAAGLEIRPESVDAFRDAFQRQASAVLTEDDLVAKVPVDVELDLSEANESLYKLLRHFGPFGAGNPEPVFVTRGARVAGYPKIVGDAHVKMMLVGGDGARLPAIGFGMGPRLNELDVSRGPLDVAYHLQEDHWNGRTSLRARLVDLQPSA